MSSTLLRRSAGALALLVASALIAATPARSPGRIEGFVRDQANAPITGAQVFVVGTGRAVTTDVRGHYLIPGLQPGLVDLRVGFAGYRQVVLAGVPVTSGQVTQRDFVLEPAGISGDAETLRDNGTKDGPLPADRIADVLALQPGVVASRGDGHRAAPRTDGKATASNSFQEATVTTGGSSAQYGNATSGVISIEGGRPVAPPACCWSYPQTPPQNFNTEEYAHLRENGFRPVASAPLSTFSIDVDKASYANVRRFLTQGSLPPADAVRIEEMINYFSYDLPEPRGADPFSVTTEVATAPWASEHRLVRIGIQGKRFRGDRLPPSNLVFLIDVSGSMDEENKLPLVKKSLRLLVGQLREEDKVSIVVYAGNAGLVLPCTPGTEKTRILDAIDRLEAGGSTAGGAGIQLAYDIARRNFEHDGNNRVILATDGDFNVGASSEGELDRLIERERRDGISLTVLGFGTGNYADQRMESLADKGNGNYFYVDNLTEGRKVFVEELQGTLFTIAKDVKIQVEFNPAEVASYRLIGYEDRALRDEDFNNDTVDAGELGAGHSVTALYEVVPVGASDVSSRPGVDPLRYQTPARRNDAPRGELLTVKLRYQAPEGGASRLIETPVRDTDRREQAMSADLGFAAAVAEWGMLLRNSEFKGTSSAAQVLELARAHRGGDEDGYRAEFIQLVRTWTTLARNQGDGVGVVE